MFDQRSKKNGPNKGKKNKKNTPTEPGWWAREKADRERQKAGVDLAWSGFDRRALQRVCEAHETSFGDAYDMEKWVVASRKGRDDFFYYKNNGSDTLFVAHLDTVVFDDERQTDFAETAAGLVVHSGALDDRLGAYIGLELLPRLGIKHDWLLTVGEESGRSTAEFFPASIKKAYDWIIEFDRGGTDVVMYEYEDDDVVDLVEDVGAKVGLGSFTDICYLEDLGCKGFNWGVGYQDYHCTRGYAYLEDTMGMVARYLRFHENNVGHYMPHVKKPKYTYAYGGGYSGGGGGGWTDDDDVTSWGGYRWNNTTKQWDPVDPVVDAESDILSADEQLLRDKIEEFTGRKLDDLTDEETAEAVADMAESGYLSQRIIGEIESNVVSSS